MPTRALKGMTGVAVDDGAGIAAGLAAGFDDDLPLGPGLTTVCAAAQDEVDLVVVSAGVLAGFAKGEYGAGREGG